jgi:hypothetical protein
MGYKALGFAAWNGGKLLLRVKYGKRLPSGRVVLAGAGAAAIGAIALTSVIRSGE